jgi:predicted flap endonuclease-1-like 5' DNA nuclease
MMDVIRDAWPWVLTAFLLGLLLGWLTTWLYYRKRVAELEHALRECREMRPASIVAGAPEKTFTADELAAASTVIGRKVRMNDLRLVEGIGPKIEGLMNADGIDTWRELADAPVSRLENILDAAGNRYAMHDPRTWSRQAALLASGKWAEFKQLTDELDGGK